jgi:hypothetical protein
VDEKAIKIALRALKIYIEVQGMKALNASRLSRGLAQGYDERCFYDAAKDVEKLVNELDMKETGGQ